MFIASQRRLKLYLLTLFLSLALLFYSLGKMAPIIVDVEDFLGLTSLLPVSYWIGLLIIVGASMLAFYDARLKSDALLISLLLMLGLYLVAAPALAQNHLRDWVSPSTTALLRTGHHDLSPPWPFAFSRPWPASQVSLVSLALVTGVTDILDLAKYGPLFTLPPFALITFFLGRRLGLSPQRSFGLSYLVLVSLWIPWTFYISPKFLGLLTYLLLFWLLATTAFRQEARYRLLTILAFLQLVVTHLLTSLVVVLFSIFGSVRSRGLFGLAMLFVVSFSAWYLYANPLMFEIGVTGLRDQLLESDPFTAWQTKTALVTTSAQTVFAFRFAYFGILGLPMLAGLGAYTLGRVKTENRPWVRVCLYWLVSTVPIALISFSAEFYDRAYLFAVLPIACIIFLTISRPAILAVLMLAATLIYIPARYGQEAAYMMYTSELKGVEFLATRTHPQRLAYSYLIVFAWYYNPSFSDIPTLIFDLSKPEQALELLNSSDYVADSLMQDNILRLFLGSNYIRAQLRQESKRMDLIYNNGGFKLYNIAPGESA